MTRERESPPTEIKIGVIGARKNEAGRRGLHAGFQRIMQPYSLPIWLPFQGEVAKQFYVINAQHA